VIAAAGVWLVTTAPAFGAAVAYQADAAHSGFVPDGPNPPLGRKWIRRDLGALFAYPVIAEGRVFVTTYPVTQSGSSFPAASTLHSLDRATGATVWSRQVTTGGLLAYDEGRLYVLGREALDAVSAATGERLWRAELRDTGGAAPVADGAFVYASDSSGAYAISADTGLKVQTKPMPDSGFTVVGDRVYAVRGGCNTIALFTRGLAQQAWSRSGPCNTSSDPVPGAYHSMNTTPPHERLWARDANGQTGLVVDAVTSLGTEQFTSAGGIALAGDLAFLRHASSVQARNHTSGVIAWSASPAAQLRGSLLAVRDAVWTTTADGELVALRRSDGGELFRTPLLTAQARETTTGEVRAPHSGMAADADGLVVPYGDRLVALGPGPDAPGIDDPDKIAGDRTQLTAAMQPRDFDFGAKVRVTGRVTTALSPGQASSSEPHQLELQADAWPYDGVWAAVDSTQSSGGGYSLDHRPDRNTRYRVVDISTAPTVVSQEIQAWVYPRYRLRLGWRGVGRVRVAASVGVPDYLKLNGKRMYVYRLRSRRARTADRIGSIKLKRSRGTTYRAAATIRVPRHRARTDYFLICIKLPDGRQLTRINRAKDPCGGRRL
jgi:hypothetical protein